MLAFNVKRILLENEYAGIRPNNMSQLATAMDISYKHLYNLIHRAREDDIERIALGLGIPVEELSP